MRSTSTYRCLRAAGTVAVVLLIAVALAVLVPALLGYQRYVIEGGSMGGALPRGSIAYDEVVPTARLRPGDVITYTPPGRSRAVSHRIVWAGRGPHGVRIFRTRGDANRAPDPWTFSLRARTQARVAFHLPLVGYALAALSVRAIRVLLLGVPALAIAAGAFARAWRSARAPGTAGAAQDFG